jgi:hypothetical protein
MRFCGCSAALKPDSLVKVFLLSNGEQFVDSASLIRSEAADTPYHRHAFRFAEKSGQWDLQ